MTTDHVVTDTLSNRLQACSQGQLTGRLHIQASKARQWSLYFHQGNLVGDAGGVHPFRRWCRQLSVHCPQLGFEPGSIRAGRRQCWNYDSLAQLVRQNEIMREQMLAVIEGSLVEVLFNILQQEALLSNRPEAKLTYTHLPKDTLNSLPIFIQASVAFNKAQQAWEAWQKAGLGDFLPDWAPVIWQQEELQKHTSPGVYSSLAALVDGKRTLRDLAMKLKQEPFLLTKSLVPYVREVWIGLIEVADLSPTLEQLKVTPSKSAPVTPMLGRSQKQPTGPLVAYIDDSPIDSQIMGQILTQAGLKYVNIRDSVQALPILLENRPSLIFLDLVMPIANGYEICTQIRRTSIFKDTPVVIVTGNDGIVDRVRAKMVGASDFLGKPIDTEKVMAILNKHISVPVLGQ